MDERPIEIMLSKRQFEQIETSAYQATIKGISKANEEKVQKNWMKSSDLPRYLPIGNSAIQEHLKDLPYHLVGGTKFFNREEVDRFLLNK